MIRKTDIVAVACLLAVYNITPSRADPNHEYGAQVQLVDAHADELIGKAFEKTKPNVREFRRIKFINIYFFTTRNLDKKESDAFDTKGIKDFDRLFEDQFGGPQFGVAQVAFPESREPGTPGMSLKVDEENPYRDFSVIEFMPIAQTNQFLDRLQHEVRGKPAGRIAVYVHGFENSFTDSIKAAAQLQSDLDMSAVVAFSWPSDKRQGYFGEKYDNAIAELQKSKIYLPFVVAYTRMATAEKRLNLIAHSMGGRLVFEAYQDLLTSPSHPFADETYKLSHTILAAPDLATSNFEKRNPYLLAYSGNMTLFCANDYALRASLLWNREYRLGFCTDRVDPIPGIRVVQVDGQMVDWFRHSYFLGAKEMVRALKNALAEAPPIKEQPGVKFEGVEHLHLH